MSVVTVVLLSLMHDVAFVGYCILIVGEYDLVVL